MSLSANASSCDVFHSFKEDVENIYESLPTEGVQHMLWSATVPDWIKTLANTMMNKPAFIDLVGTCAGSRPAAVDLGVALPLLAFAR